MVSDQLLLGWSTFSLDYPGHLSAPITNGEAACIKRASLGSQIRGREGLLAFARVFILCIVPSDILGLHSSSRSS